MSLTRVPSAPTKVPSAVTNVPSAVTDIPTHAGLTRLPDVSGGVVTNYLLNTGGTDILNDGSSNRLLNG